jgi:kynurenine formamidase
MFFIRPKPTTAGTALRHPSGVKPGRPDSAGSPVRPTHPVQMMTIPPPAGEAAWMSDYAMSEAEFRALYDRLRRVSAWVPADRRGALNNISMSDVVAAANDVRVGRTVSLAAPFQGPAADNPDPAVHEMTHSEEGPARASGLTFATDRLALNIHGNADSHMDALSHVLFDGTLYNGIADGTATAQGATELSIDVAGQGIAGRGLLLDIPKLRGVQWLEPGDHVTADDLLAAESAQAERIGQGDLLFVRVGHRARRRSLGPWDAAGARAGLHPAALELLAERRIGVLGSDGNNDTAPSAVEGVDFPVHVLAINAMGLHLLDYLDFKDLVTLCEELRRWSFLCVLAPLRLPAGTGSPVNPIAIF